ncbi:uncharacterized protein LOC116175519 [Photinus pyralis]|uniref:uncharacterized protein LOC116175519 n=1 Tax=Photinus pyralis TaxID=7054 RepID=UPI00126703BA|nr:uncharacterized protein LOC116175519 [Photinus pyralis]
MTEPLKKRRTVARGAFTRAFNTFMETVCTETTLDVKQSAFQLLEIRLKELYTSQEHYNKKLFQSDMSEDEISAELESDDTYHKQFIDANIAMNKFLASATQSPEIVPSFTQKALSKLQIPKFEGSVKEWLPFWSQFKKYHEDPTLSNEVKFQYLLQATVEKSSAKNIVTSFPPTGDNYEKAIESLKNRFGRDDLVKQFYVRELLALVLQNASDTRKPKLSDLYDKLGSHLRALNSLGVMKKDYATLLYPLVESCLPEEVLRAWKQFSRKDGLTTESHDQLTQLMTFLELEVCDQETIKMAMTGFNITANQEGRKQLRGKQTYEVQGDVATANALFVSKSNLSCIFCNGEHENNKCTVARKLNFDERKNIVKREKCCFRCLKHGHNSKSCRVKLSCSWCSGRHTLLLCELVNKHEKSAYVSDGESDTNTRRPQKTAKENNLTTLSGCPEVCLPTARVVLYSDTRERVIRVLFDSGSQRSYVLSSVAEELGYESHGKQEVIHSLFGGQRSKVGSHDLILIRLRDLNNRFACKFIALGQDIICESIPQLKCKPLLKKLDNKDIHLSDIDGDSTPIEVLIGADVIGKLFTGKICELSNGLTSFKTKLGWTVTGKLPSTSQLSDSAILLNAMFIETATPTDLWQLDLLGITDPIETVERSEIDMKARKYVLETANFNSDGRYEVRLPWVDNHQPLPTNFEIAWKRLLSNVKKLKGQNIFLEYDEILDNWLSENIIEKVPFSKGDLHCHYLPHRAVLKPGSTTPIRPVFDASASTPGKPSLNNCLEKGPNMIALIPNIINRFREGKIGIIADIKRAFLQINVAREDRDFLRFLWFKNEELVTYRHRRVVFGLSCSPFLLAAIIELHLNNCSNDQNMARNHNFQKIWSADISKKLKESFYVDNCITSVNTVDELHEFIKTASEIFVMGGFNLRGWEYTLDTTSDNVTNILGLRWDKRKDVIMINPDALGPGCTNNITKRTILSTTHKIFDPIGVTCPVSLQPKL